MADAGLYKIGTQQDYLGGYLATGLIAIVQTVTPLLMAQLWRKDTYDKSMLNPWYANAWKAMQAGGVVAYGLQALAFLGSFLFEFGIMERLGLVMLWITHGTALSFLSITTVFAYFCVSLYRFKSSGYIEKKEIRIASSVYLITQFGLFLTQAHFMKDSIMYLVAGELKALCENYGAFCGEMGILEPNDSAQQASSLILDNWSY